MNLVFLLFMLGQVHGTVHDNNKHRIAAAIVYLQQDGTQTPQSTKTDQNGDYSFASVPSGTFRLRTEAAGFATTISEPFSVGTQQSATVDLILQPGFFDEPQYTVAGVTDNTYRGGHGSDTVLRSSEALTKATASLGKNTAPNAMADESALRKMADSQPHSFSANYKLAQVLVANGKCKDALPYLERALAADNSNADAFHLSGDANERLGNSLNAVRAYQTAARLQPSEANTFDLGTELLTHLAPEAAIQVFTKGHSEFPASTRILLGLAASLYSRGLYEEAARRFFEACDLNPVNPQPYLFMGKIQRSEITHSKGFVKRMRRFAQLRPDNAWADYFYAVALQNQENDTAHVKELLDTAIKLDPNFAEAYLLRGAVNVDLQDLKKAISLDPTLAEAHYRLAQILKLRGQTEEAKAEFQRYEQISKQNAVQIERQRNETQRFVVALRSQSQ